MNATPPSTRFSVVTVSLDGTLTTGRPLKSRAIANDRARRAAKGGAVAWVVSVEPVAKRAPAVEEFAFRVVRRGPGNLVKVYPIFATRELADHVAMLAANKHRSARVTVEPVAA